MSTRPHTMPFGATLQADGTLFRLFAPACGAVRLRIGGRSDPITLAAGSDGWHETFVPGAQAGTRYSYELPDGLVVPDPASRFQPEDTQGPSQVVDPSAFPWSDGAWHGRPWAETVLYELHIGTFTPAGTFRGAIEKLPHLRDLGVTAIEIMPVADFSGKRNWGYDGVLLYAPDSAYGTPDDFRALVDAAHEHGISVILDVVYNHYGPEGNYLSAYAPQFFTDRHHTPWGQAINYDGEHSRVVRDFAIHNALYWIEDFHIDGFRLDAVHAIVDDGPKHFLTEFAERMHGLACGRPIHLVMENEDNQSSRLARSGAEAGRFTAQWNDDVHHVLHTALTTERVGYYKEYADDTAKLGRALAEGFAFQGEMMPYRGSPRGEPSADLPPTAFVAFIQNHDQIGNRAFGDRLTASVAPEALRAAGAVYLLLPQIPMLFMGEEWGTSTPFQFFCDFTGGLADAVRNGRREEFKHFPQFHDKATRDTIPDPLAETTFRTSTLDWSELDLSPYRESLTWHREILRVRRERIVPFTAQLGHGGSFVEIGPEAVAVTWRTGEAVLRLDANLKAEPQAGFDQAGGEIVWQEGHADGDVLGAWTVRWQVIVRAP